MAPRVWEDLTASSFVLASKPSYIPSLKPLTFEPLGNELSYCPNQRGSSGATDRDILISLQYTGLKSSQASIPFHKDNKQQG